MSGMLDQHMRLATSDICDARATFIGAFEAAVVERLPLDYRTIVERAIDRDENDRLLATIRSDANSVIAHILGVPCANANRAADRAVAACVERVRAQLRSCDNVVCFSQARGARRRPFAPRWNAAVPDNA